MAVYAKKNSSFKYTDKAISVTGTLKFGNYTDDFGYVYNYRIENATYSEIDTSNMSDTLRLWQSFASTGLLQDIQAMYEYVNFVCFWYTYTAKFTSGEDYLYPSDAVNFIKNDGTQYNYGYVPGYFDDLVTRIEAVDKEAFSELVQNIRDAEALAGSALSELENKNYHMEPEGPSGYFGDGRTMYKLDKADEFDAEMQRVYGNFSLWLASWEV